MVVLLTPEEKKNPRLRLNNLMTRSIEIMALLASLPKDQKNYFCDLKWLKIAEKEIKELQKCQNY